MRFSLSVGAGRKHLPACCGCLVYSRRWSALTWRLLNFKSLLWTRSVEVASEFLVPLDDKGSFLSCIVKPEQTVSWLSSHTFLFHIADCWCSSSPGFRPGWRTRRGEYCLHAHHWTPDLGWPTMILFVLFYFIVCWHVLKVKCTITRTNLCFRGKMVPGINHVIHHTHVCLYWWTVGTWHLLRQLKNTNMAHVTWPFLSRILCMETTELWGWVKMLHH